MLLSICRHFRPLVILPNVLLLVCLVAVNCLSRYILSIYMSLQCWAVFRYFNETRENQDYKNSRTRELCFSIVENSRIWTSCINVHLLPLHVSLSVWVWAMCLGCYFAPAAVVGVISASYVTKVTGIRVLDKSWKLKFSYREIQFSKINIIGCIQDAHISYTFFTC